MARTKNREYQQVLSPAYTFSRRWKMGDTGLWEGSGAPLRPRFRAGTIVAQPTAPHKKKHRLPATQLGGEPIS